MNNLKQIVYISLLLLIVLTTAGLPVEVHFCGNKFSGVSVFESSHTDCCKSEGKRRKRNCCNEVKVDIKVKDNHLQAALLQVSAPLQPIFTHEYASIWHNNVQQSFEHQVFLNRYPPPLLDDKRHLRLGVLLI